MPEEETKPVEETVVETPVEETPAEAPVEVVEESVAPEAVEEAPILGVPETDTTNPRNNAF